MEISWPLAFGLGILIYVIVNGTNMICERLDKIHKTIAKIESDGRQQREFLQTIASISLRFDK
jgi:hypothetical protein